MFGFGQSKSRKCLDSLEYLSLLGESKLKMQVFVYKVFLAQKMAQLLVTSQVVLPQRPVPRKAWGPETGKKGLQEI